MKAPISLKNGSTLFLKLVVGTMALVALMASVFVFPRTIIAERQGDFDYMPMLLALYATALISLVALYQTLKLLSYIDHNKAFSRASIAALRTIRYCAAIISLIFALELPYMFVVADRDDAPGVVAVGLLLAGGSFVVATAVAVFQKLMQSAVDMKSEQDLTV